MKRFLNIFIFASLLVTSLSLWPSKTIAQDKTSLNKKEVEQLLSTLKNEEERKAFIADLELLIKAKETTKPEEQPESISDYLLAQLNELQSELNIVIKGLKNYQAGLDYIYSYLADSEFYPILFYFIFQLALVFIAGLLVEFILRKLLAKKRAAIEEKKLVRLSRKIGFLFVRTLLDVIPIAGFAIASFFALTFVEGQKQAIDIIYSFIMANVAIRVFMALYLVIFVPKAQHLRIFKFKNVDAVYLFSWAKRLTKVCVYGWFFGEVLLILSTNQSLYDFYLKLVGFLITALVVLFILQNKHHFAQWLKKMPPKSNKFATIKNQLAAAAYILLIIYVAILYSIWLFDVKDGFQMMFENTIYTIIIIAVASFIGHLCNRFSTWFVSIDTAESKKYPSLGNRMKKYSGALKFLLNGILTFFAFLFILQIWGVYSLGVTSSILGQKILFSTVTIFFITILTFSLWEIVQYTIDKILHDKIEEGDARLRTLLPLVKNVFLVILTIIAVLLVLSELGVNIAPLLAGAGVLGLAIGFGSQALVKDVITGFFILVEDSISIGDVVTVSGHTGVVNQITIRTIRLRDVSGNVHTIPFSEVTTIVNMTKTFSYALLEIGVAYRENIDDVIEVIKEIGHELEKDLDVQEDILEPIEVLGLDQFADSAVVIKARIKTKPLKQWRVKRAYNLLMKRKFDELGIEIPFPHVTVYAGEDKDGNAPALPVRTDETKGE